MPSLIEKQEREKLNRPMLWSVLLHIGIVGGLTLLIYIFGFFHGQEWGNNSVASAIQANLVSSGDSSAAGHAAQSERARHRDAQRGSGDSNA